MLLSTKSASVIDPDKCTIEDWEVLSFENEEQLRLYTIWHDDFKSIGQPWASKISNNINGNQQNATSPSRHKTSSVAPDTNGKSSIVCDNKPLGSISNNNNANKSPNRLRPILSTSRKSPPSRANKHVHHSSTMNNGLRPLPEGYAIMNPCATPWNKQTFMKYKTTKLYNKYRGQQIRRNLVRERQQESKIEAGIQSSYLNTWLSYTALQALRIPSEHHLQLQQQQQQQSSLDSASSPMLNNGQQSTQPQPQLSLKQPFIHLIYISPGNYIAYSNQIKPQQVADYKRKSQVVPQATSKKSSAASYDANEIMEVLANTNKTNVTLTRNVNKANKDCERSIYNHSVNANTPGIVSTQLHLQARSYLDSVSKFYAEEWQLIEKRNQEKLLEPSVEDEINRYLNPTPINQH